MIVVAHITGMPDLTFDGQTWSGPWPALILRVLNEHTPPMPQHYTAFDVARQVLDDLYGDKFRLEVTEQDELEELPAGAIA